MGISTMNLNISEIRKNLAGTLKLVAHDGERIILRRRGKGVAALVPIEDLEFLQELEDKADLAAARKARKEQGGITLEAYKKKHGL